MEYCDIYDASKTPTGKVLPRGTPTEKGEYTLVSCVWITDGKGRLLLTRRAPEKRASPNLWENSGGGVLAGETSRQAIVREVYEETGIRAEEEEFSFMCSFQEGDAFFDLYFLCKDVPLEALRLQPGETVEARWVTVEKLREMIASGMVAPPIARRFFMQERELLKRIEKLYK